MGIYLMFLKKMRERSDRNLCGLLKKYLHPEAYEKLVTLPENSWNGILDEYNRHKRTCKTSSDIVKKVLWYSNIDVKGKKVVNVHEALNKGIPLLLVG